MKENIMLTIGYIGNGKSTNRYHLPFVIQRENIKVKTIYQRNPKNESWDRISNVEYTSDLNSLLNDEEIDLIVVCKKMDSNYDYDKMVLKKSKKCYHIPLVIQRKNIKVKTIYQRNHKNESWDRISNVEYTSDLNSLLNDEEIDLIVVCTKMDSHYDYAKMVLQHNKHCLVEKPFMETSEQAREIFSL